MKHLKNVNLILNIMISNVYYLIHFCGTVKKLALDFFFQSIHFFLKHYLIEYSFHCSKFFLCAHGIVLPM